MLEFGARHWYELSVAEFMIHGADVFGEFAELLDGHEAGGNRHNVQFYRNKFRAEQSASVLREIPL
jgi:hypothetical protein